MSNVPLGKVEPPGGDPMMTVYVVMHVLRLHRDMPAYQAAQANREWRRAPIVARAKARRLPGLRHDGQGAGAGLAVAGLQGLRVGPLAAAGRRGPALPRPRSTRGVSRSDRYRRLPLPLTADTEGIFCARTFAMMPRGAMLVNVGRGKHVVDKDLIAALNSGQLSYAALDALWPEPLPSENRWRHRKVTVCRTWHGADRGPLVTEVAANIRSL